MEKMDKKTTLRDLWRRGELHNALKYLDCVLDRYKEVSRDLGECTISIGLIGTGYGPNYRIRPLQDIELSPIEDRLKRSGELTPEQIKEDKFLFALGGAYSGRSHKPLSSDIGGRDPENWSQPPMSHAELLRLRHDVSQTEKAAAKARHR